MDTKSDTQTAGQAPALALTICSRPSPEFVVVFGPPCSGKTINAEALKAHYKCDLVFDAGFGPCVNGRSARRILILSHTEKVRLPKGRRRILSDVLRVPVREAAIALGAQWIPASVEAEKGGPPAALAVTTGSAALTQDEINFLLWCVGFAEGRARTAGHLKIVPQCDAVRNKLMSMTGAET